MKKNMSTVDIIVRIMVALVIIGLFFAKVITGFWAITLLLIAGIFFITSLVGTCPLYMLLGISTKKENPSV